MIFRRSIQRYGTTPEPVTPYQKAAQLWDERIGSARVQARNWRLMALGSLAMAVGLAGGLLWQSVQSRVVPYVVEVDRFGEARAVGPAVQPYNPTDAQIGYFLARFITDVRSLSSDPVVVKQDWLSAYAFATQRCANFLDAYARAHDPFKAIGKETVSVQVTSVIRVSDASFQVKWIEQHFGGDVASPPQHWTAILSITVHQPSNEDTLRQNPLGLYVDGIDWSRDLDKS